MKLHYHPFSPNVRTVLMAADILGIQLELKLVDLESGEHKTPEYLQLNPNGMVPTLEDEGFVLWEANAIVQYLASTKSRQTLYPVEPKARADVARWLFWDLSYWTPPTQTLAFERMFKKMLGMGEPDPDVVNRSLNEFHRVAKIVDGHLGKHAHMVNGKLTLADLSLASRLSFAGPAQYPLAEYRNLSRWFDSIRALDAWKKTEPTM